MDILKQMRKYYGTWLEYVLQVLKILAHLLCPKSSHRDYVLDLKVIQTLEKREIKGYMQSLKYKKGHFWLRKRRQAKDAKFASILEDQCRDIRRFHVR